MLFLFLLPLLVQLLSLFPSLSLGAVLELVADSLEPTGGDVKATEARGMYFGQVFALLAIIKSGRLVDKVHSILHSANICEKSNFLHLIRSRIAISTI